MSIVVQIITNHRSYCVVNFQHLFGFLMLIKNESLYYYVYISVEYIKINFSYLTNLIKFIKLKKYFNMILFTLKLYFSYPLLCGLMHIYLMSIITSLVNVFKIYPPLSKSIGCEYN